jgi:hypothetical protein
MPMVYDCVVVVLLPRILPDPVVYPSRWWVAVLLAVTLTIWGALFAAVTLFDDRDGSAGHALSIAIGTEDPFESAGADGPAVVLATMSWLLVPAVIGAVVALVLAEELRRSRVTPEQAEAELEKLRKAGAEDTTKPETQ